MATKFADHVLAGTHAERPDATAVVSGALFACSDHTKVYQSDGSAWSEWFVGGGGGGGTLGPAAAMRKSSGSQTLTNGSEDEITFDTEIFDTDGSLVDLPNNRFIIQAAGVYLINAVWPWESGNPGTNYHIAIKNNGATFTPLIRNQGDNVDFGSLEGSRTVQLALNDEITMTIDPGASGVVARANANAWLSTTFSIARVA